MMLLSMLTIVLTWLAWSGALVGIGASVIRLLDPRDPRRSLALSFWTGFATLLPVLIGVHFVLPISGWLHWGILVVGWLLALSFGRERIASVLREQRDTSITEQLASSPREHRITSPNEQLATAAQTILRRRRIAAILLTFWLANRACAPGVATDAGSYHYPAIDWCNTYAVVPGLANFSPSQAMNNASFLFAALLNAGPWSGRVEHVVTGLLVFVATMMTLAPLRRAFSRGASPADWSLVAMLPMLLFIALGSEIATPDTDVPPGLLSLVLGHFCIRQFFPETPGDDDPRRLPVLAVLVAALITLKLSAGMFAVLLALALIIHHARRLARRDWLEPASFSAAIVAFVGVSWMARGIMLSGYPLYPSGAFGVGVDWRLPDDRLDYLQEAISKTPRAQVPLWLSGVIGNSPLRFYAPLMTPPFDDYDGVTATNWIRPWFFTLPFTGSIEFILPTLLTLVLLLLAWRRGATSTDVFLLLTPLLLMLAFWFLASPDARYIWGAAWFGVGASAASLASRGGSLPRFSLVMLLLLSFVPGIIYKAAVEVLIHKRNAWRSLPLVLPGSDRGMHPRPVAVYEPWTSRHGVLVHLQTTDTLCWQGPLPRVGWPKPDPDLAYRTPGDLSGGFVIRRDAR